MRLPFQQFDPARAAEFPERVELINLAACQGRTHLLVCQVRLTIKFDDATAASFPLSHNLLTEH
jgi:hypothetical protein